MINDIALDQFLRVMNDLQQHALNDAAAAVQCHESQPGPLPLLLEFQLRHRDVVFFLHTVFEAGQTLPFILERMRVGEVDVQRKETDNHLDSVKLRLYGFDFFEHINFDHIPRLNVFEIRQADAAFQVFLHFGDIVFEVLQ